MNAIKNFVSDYARAIVLLFYVSVMIPLVTKYLDKGPTLVVISVLLTAVTFHCIGRLTESNVRLKELDDMAKKGLDQMELTLTKEGSNGLKQIQRYFELSSITQVVEFALRIHNLIVSAFSGGAKVMITFDWPDGRANAVDPIDIIMPGYDTEEDEDEEEEGPEQ